jgi:iron complex outermembrane receptor protein
MPLRLPPAFVPAVVLPTLLLAPARAATPPAKDSGLTEVLVTAQRRSQNVQRIGVAITAVSGATVQSRRVLQPLDLAALSPSLSTMNATTDSTPLFLIRGVGLDDFNTNNSSNVATYIDDIYASLPGFLTATLFDLDRVEILKGPQGTLYGRNSAGGAINLISAQPTDHLTGYLDASYSRWETADVSGAISGPLSNIVTARLAFTTTEQGQGYQTDIDTGKKYGKLSRGGVRSIVDIRPNAATTLELNLHYLYDNSTPSSPSTPDVEALAPANLPFPPPFPIAGLLNSPPGGTLVRTGGLALFKHDTSAGTAGKLIVDLGRFTITSITGFDYFAEHQLDNYDGYPAADNNYTKHFQQWQFSQEVRAASKPGGIVDWIVGADYSQNYYRNHDSLDWTFVYGLATSITDTGKAITAANFTQTQHAEGVYAHAETHLSPHWSIVTGLRYSHESVSFNGTTIDPTGLLTYSANGFTGPIIPNTVLAALDQSRSSQNVSFRAELDDHLTRQVLLYASVATGYKGGIFYGQPAQTQADWGYVEPETEITTELGAKTRLLANTLEFNAAAFDTAIRNRQSSLSLYSGPVGTQPLIAGLGNVPRARIDGVEFETHWRPIENLTIDLAGTYLDGRVTETLTNDRGLALFTPVAIGQMLPDAPRLAGNWAIAYTHPLTTALTAFAQLENHYTGAEHPYLADPTTFGGGQSLNARIGLSNPAAHWQASLWGTNLTNDRYLTYAFAGSEGQRVSFYQKPWSLGVELRYTL